MAEFHWKSNLRKHSLSRVSRRKSTSDVLSDVIAKKSPVRKLSVVDENEGEVFSNILPLANSKRYRDVAKANAKKKIIASRQARLSIPEQPINLKVQTTQENQREPRKSWRNVAKPKHLEIIKVNHEKEAITSPVPLPPGVECIDPSEDNGMFEYWPDYIYYLKIKEQNWIFHRREITDGNSDVERNRKLLMNWTLELALHFGVSQETLYHTVRMIDTTLTKRTVQSDKLQLVGITAFFIAAKLEEYYPPNVTDLLDLTENSYTLTEVYKMEIKLLKIMKGLAYAPEPMIFLNRFIQASFREEDDLFINTCQLFVDLFIPSINYSGETSSKKAAVAVLLSRMVLPTDQDRSYWTPTLTYYTGYHYNELVPLAKVLLGELSKIIYDLNSSKQGNMSGFVKKFRSRSRHMAIILTLADKKKYISNILSKLF